MLRFVILLRPGNRSIRRNQAPQDGLTLLMSTASGEEIERVTMHLGPPNSYPKKEKAN